MSTCAWRMSNRAADLLAEAVTRAVQALAVLIVQAGINGVIACRNLKNVINYPWLLR